MLTSEKISQSDNSDRRGADRSAIWRNSTARGVEGAAHDVVVRDLSAHGFSVETSVPLPIGSGIQIGLPGVGRVAAHVRWSDGAAHGCELVVPLTHAQLNAAFATETVVLGRFASKLVPGLDQPEPEVGHWRGVVRVGLILSGAGMLWAAIWAIV